MDEKLLMEELTFVQKEVELKGKRMNVAFVLLFLFGSIGAHLAYLQKTKLTVIRVLFSALTVAAIFPIAGIIQEAELNGATLEMKQMASSVSVLWLLLVVGHFIWFIYDLTKISNAVATYNKTIEASAKVQALQARNVEERLRADAISKIIIDKSVEEILSQVEEHRAEEKRTEELTVIDEVVLENTEVSTVENALQLEKGQAMIEGYIVGTLKNGVKVTNESLFKNDSVILIADSPEEKNTSKMIIVQIPNKLQSKFGLNSNSEVKGKKVLASGRIRKYYGSYGLKEVTKISIRD